MKFLILFLLLTSCNGESRWKKAFKVSIGVLVAANVADTTSSYGMHELNPVLGRGRFGPRQTVMKFTLTTGLITAQYLIHRKTDKYDKPMAILNFTTSGVLTGTAIRNYRLRRE